MPTQADPAPPASVKAPLDAALLTLAALTKRYLWTPAPWVATLPGQMPAIPELILRRLDQQQFEVELAGGESYSAVLLSLTADGSFGIVGCRQDGASAAWQRVEWSDAEVRHYAQWLFNAITERLPGSEGPMATDLRAAGSRQPSRAPTDAPFSSPPSPR